MKKGKPSFDLKNLTLPKDDPYCKQVTFPDGEVGRLTRVPEKVRRRRKYFAMLPMEWYDRMQGASGQTYRVAWYLLFMHWRGKGAPIKLNNVMLETDGVSRQSKWKALADLERRGLITVERRRHRSPLVQLLLV
jgi:hypothetical protein